MNADLTTEVYGLLGYPLGHSFSVGYFTDKFLHTGLRAVYRNFEFKSLPEALRGLEQMPALRGFNVTIPYKQAIIPYLHTLSPEAREIGAVNVVKVRRNGVGRWFLEGYNTDVTGFEASIRPLISAEIHRKALVLGTGGASLAVKYALRRLQISPLSVSRQARNGSITYADLTPQLLARYQVIVNCTPLGMFPHVGTYPSIPYHLLTPSHLLYDLVYNPSETLFMCKGAAQGAVVKNGLEMLHRQAEAAWSIWQGEEP